MYRYLKEGGPKPQGDAVSQISKPVSLSITGGEGEASISDKLQDHLNHVIIW